NPLQLGYRTTTWTVELLADHLSRSAVGLGFWVTGAALFETLMLRGSPSPGQIFKSIPSALCPPILLLFQHQEFRQNRKPGIDFSEGRLVLDDCLTAARSPSGASHRNPIRSQHRKTSVGDDRYQSVSSFSLKALINELNSNPTRSSWYKSRKAANSV